MSRRELWLCLSLLVCACSVEDAPEPAEDLGEDSNSADQATDQEMRDIQAQDQGDDVPAPVDMSDDIRPDDIPPDIPVEVDVPVDMSADTTTQDLSVDVDAQDDTSADIVLDAEVDVEQDPDIEDINDMQDIEDELDVIADDTGIEDVAEDNNEEIVDTDIREEVDIEYDFPIGPDYPTNRFVDLNVSLGTCAIREQDNLRYCWAGGASRSDVAFSQLTHWGCGLTLEGDLSCFGGQFVEGPFLNVHASLDANGVCLVREDHSAYCIYSFEPYIAKEYAGQYKKVISIDHYGICGINLNDEIRCEPYYIGEENVFYFDVRERSYDILFEYPRDIRVRDIVTEYSGTCACALTLENTIRCWGGLYRDGCRNSLEPLFPGQYLYINTFLALNCGVTLDGRAHCIPEFQQNAERLNPHGPFVKVSHAASCALKTNGEIVCIDQLPPVSETTGRKIVVEEEDYCSLDEQGYATCRDLLTGNVWASTPNIRFSLIKLVYEGRAYGLDTEGRFYYWSKNPPYTSARLMALIPDDLRAKNVFPKVNNNICFHKMDDTVQCFLFDESQPTMLNDEMPDPERMFLDVDFQRHFACAVSYTGTLTCWGDIDFPEFQNSDFIDIEYDRNNLCGINTNGNLYCFKMDLDWNMVNVFSGSTMRKLIFISDSVICGLSNGGNVLCEVNSLNSFPGDLLLAEEIENQFEIYNFMDISSSALGRQICGIREDVNTLVCRGVTGWGW